MTKKKSKKVKCTGRISGKYLTELEGLKKENIILTWTVYILLIVIGYIILF